MTTPQNNGPQPGREQDQEDVRDPQGTRTTQGPGEEEE